VAEKSQDNGKVLFLFGEDNSCGRKNSIKKQLSLHYRSRQVDLAARPDDSRKNDLAYFPPTSPIIDSIHPSFS
jgi:hypothetical protein